MYIVGFLQNHLCKNYYIFFIYCVYLYVCVVVCIHMCECEVCLVTCGIYVRLVYVCMVYYCVCECTQVRAQVQRPQDNVK